MRNAFVLVFIGFVFLLALKWRYVALLNYWWIGIFRPQDWVYMDISSLRISLLAAVILVIPALLRGLYPKFNNSLAIMMLLLTSFAVLANQLNGCTNVAQDEATMNLVILVYITLLTVRLTDNYQKLFWFIALVSISLAFHSGKGGIYALISGNLNQYDTNKLRGMFSGSNAYALLSGVFLFYIAFTAQYINRSQFYAKYLSKYDKPKIQKFAKLVMIILTFGTMYNVISLNSRGASLAMIVSIILWIYLQPNRAKIFMTLIPLALLALAIVPLPEGYTDRLASAFNESEERDNSARSRPHFWSTAVEIAKSHPLGIGPGCYAAYYDTYDNTGGEFGYRRSVHSSHFQILADTGFLGSCIWILLFMTAYMKLFRIRSMVKITMGSSENDKFIFDLCNALICSQTVFLLGGAFYEMAYNDMTWLTWGMVIALENLYISNLDEKNQSSNTKSDPVI